MKLSKNDVQAFAHAQLRTFNLNGFDICVEKALREVESEICRDWEELRSLEVMNSRHNYFQVPGTSPLDYSEKLLELSDECKVLYGIRHLGGDKKIPFTQLCANFEIDSQATALSIYAALKDDLKAFHPKYVCFWSAHKIKVDLIGSTYLVSRASEVSRRNQSVTLKPVQDESYFEWYERGYESFHDNFPQLKSRVMANSLESMRELREQGMIFEAYIGEERVGLIGGERSSLLGHSGMYFHEIFVDTKWRGRGIAKLIQQRFIEVNARRDDFIWGTIDDSNLPSYRTALSNGRRPVRFECFVKV